jgi:hypothetical protein
MHRSSCGLQNSRSLLRPGLLSVVVVLLQAFLQGTSLAQQPSSDVPPEKARQFLELLSDPELKTWLEGKVPAATDESGLSISADILSVEAGIRARIGALGAAIPRLPEELARADDVVSRDVNSGRPGLVVGILAVLIAVGFGAEWLVRRALARMRSAVTLEDAGQAILFETVALMLRMKLMTKPGTQFTIKRRAHGMIKQAFAENGIKIAYPTVHVESGGGTEAAAHEACETLKKSRPLGGSEGHALGCQQRRQSKESTDGTYRDIWHGLRLPYLCDRASRQREGC